MGAAYVFLGDTCYGTWQMTELESPVPTTDRNFGASVAIDGQRAMILEPTENFYGVVYETELSSTGCE